MIYSVIFKNETMKSICVRFTKRTLLTILIVHLSFFGFAATYYISNAGNDSNSGLSISMPWKTLGKVNASTFVPGDQILFKRGDTFYGSLTIGHSGTSGSRIVYGPYGTGANPIITGFTAVTSWTNLGSNIWESTSAVSTLSELNMVVINGINTGMGRTPNIGYYYYQSFVGSTSITSNNLNGTPNWTGAEVAFNNTPYTLKRSTITSQSGGTLNFSTVGYIQKANQQLIIQNDPRTLDVQNEWYYNPTTKKIQIYSTSQPTNVKVSTIGELVNINGHYVTVENISFMGSNSRTIVVGGKDYVTIQNCDIRYSGLHGIYGSYTSSTGLKVEGCSITDSNQGGIGVTSYFTNIIIRSNTIVNSGIIYGTTARVSAQGNNTQASYGISMWGNNGLVELNTIQNIGYVGIRFMGNNTIVQKNYITNFCLNAHDGGGIYTWNGSNPTNSGMKVLDNIVIGTSANGVSSDSDSDAGIYLDDYSNGVEISGNTVSGCDYGIFLHEAHDVVVQGNTTFNNDKGIRLYGRASPFYMTNITVQNNIVVAKTTGQVAIHFDPLELVKPTFKSSNNCYSRPINDTKTIGGYIRTPSFAGLSNTVAEWQTYSGQDANSAKSPQSITSESDMRYDYNETNTAKTVSLSQPMMDMRGVKYTGSITLQPYKSVVLIKDVTSASVPGAPTSIVATAGNASASITFAAPASNGGSAITGYTVTSSPAGGVDASAGSTSLTRTITGLTNGTAYTFTVKATNSVGTSVASAPSNSVKPVAPSDNTPPVISSFLMPTSATSLTVPITAFSASDNIGVTGYLLAETPSTPSSSATGWTAAAPSNYTFLSSGLNALYAWVKDAAGNVSTYVMQEVTITLDTKQGAIQPTHFIPVWNGENGQNHMDFIVVSAILEDMALVAEDEIGLFSGNLCVGAQMLTKEINSADNSTYLTIQASQDDGSNNGFIDNDTIIVKMWDHRNQVEMFAKAVVYRNDMPTWITSGKYTAGATAVIEIVSYSEYTQTIELKKGYNMISTNVTADNTLACHITQPLVDQGNLIKVQDEAGNSLENWGSFGGWVNNIGSFKVTEGYKIKVANNCTLQITGRFIALPLEIPLKTGWNIISFPRTDIVDGMAVVQSLIDQGKLVKVQDEAGNSIENWGVYGGWENGIGNFIPGKAYKIKMNADAILSIHENYLKSSVILAQAEATSYYRTKVEGNGNDHMNINIVGLPESGVSVGDELAAFDGKICVGTLKITANHLNTGTACLVASSADDKGLVGFKSGNKIHVYSWDQVTGNETEVQTEVVKGQLSYEINGSVIVKLKSSSTNVVMIDEAVKIDVFPNPSSGRVTVRFSEMPDAGSKIEITDIAGRMISSRLISDTSEEFNLDQQSGGLYLVKTILGSNTTIQKLVIRK